ncbi:MAG: helix-turn-helix domain-containing protein [Cyclobacteriaceae bacterium]|nr:helix-turn-helix domain-containing protein [Cyclobacteriaceae bacterium]
MKKVAFIIPPTVELLDLAGPVQVFTEAKFYGFEVETEFFTYQKEPRSTCGLGFATLPDFTKAELTEGDFIFIPGMDQNYVNSPAFRTEKKFFMWLRECAARKIHICSVCNGAFALGEAELLNEIECTTHWRRVNELQLQFPNTNVVTDVFFVKNDYICTSAGISAGIDLALSILDDIAGAHFTHKVARGLVVYYRGNGSRKSKTSYLYFRNHINMKIHEIQDYLVENINGETSIGVLASLAGMSARNLTRIFKDTTGSTINEYLTHIRLDTAKAMLRDPKNTMLTIAIKCGFKTERQLQRILRNS